jgi:hypothetical protein
MKKKLLIYLSFVVSACDYNAIDLKKHDSYSDSLELELMVKIECGKKGIQYPFVYDSTKDYIIPRNKWLDNTPPPYHLPEHTEFEVREGLRKRGDPDWNYACELAEKKIKAEGGIIQKRSK